VEYQRYCPFVPIFPGVVPLIVAAAQRAVVIPRGRREVVGLHGMTSTHHIILCGSLRCAAVAAGLRSFFRLLCATAAAISFCGVGAHMAGLPAWYAVHA